jgi:hypothetical protein
VLHERVALRHGANGDGHQQELVGVADDDVEMGVRGKRVVGRAGPELKLGAYGSGAYGSKGHAFGAYGSGAYGTQAAG